jgi:hypothetical protein
MDLGGSDDAFDGGFDDGPGGLPPKKRELPADLPRSLDDRRHVPTELLVRETEMYDGWQGEPPQACHDAFRPSRGARRLRRERDLLTGFCSPQGNLSF